VKSDLFFLLHINDAIESINEFIAVGQDSFYKDKRTQDATIRNLEIIGEAVKNLSKELIDKNADIP
jgi:uncharacterized protein with HEPN domain